MPILIRDSFIAEDGIDLGPEHEAPIPVSVAGFWKIRKRQSNVAGFLRVLIMAPRIIEGIRWSAETRASSPSAS